MTTMKDVAKKAGVSIATVSAVVNKNKYVSDNLTKKVLKTIDELNYRPNRLAQGLAKQETYVFAYLIPSISNPIFARTVEGMEEILSKEDYTVTVINTNFKFEKYKQDSLRLLNRVDGIAITSGHSSELNQLIKKLQSKKPVIIIHSPTNVNNVVSLLADEVYGVTEAIKYLIKKGHRNIAFIGVKNSTSSENRFKAYRNILQKNKIPYNKKLVFWTNEYTKKDGFYSISQLRKKNKFSAVFAASDSLAIGALTWIHENGLKVPKDISVIGFDNTIANYAWPPLTSIQINCREMGKKAGKLLIDLKKGKEFDNKKIIIPTQLILRETT